jgi:nucleoside diphosphate kinase
MDRTAELTSRFKLIDTNHNEKLEISELKAVFGEHAAEFLKFCDAGEKDGELTCEEFVTGILGDTETMSDEDFQTNWLDRMSQCIADAVPATLKNKAFLFIKPHAVTDATKTLASESLVKKGFDVLSEGEIKAEDINSKKLIDNHYYAIASKATILKPNELNVPEDKFEEKFGLSWADALAGGRVFNALDACEDLGINAEEMDKQWGIHKKADKLIKFGGGFYCGHIEIEGKEPCYVFNGFFMQMREKYVAPGLAIYYYVVEWDPAVMSWEQFRGQALGPTDPTEAPADSVRGEIFAKWEELGLPAQPDVGDNGMHGSASPFEALAEIANWLEGDVAQEEFGAKMLEAGISAETIKAWSVDPQVKLPGEEDKKGSLFDAVEDTNAADCLAKLVEINGCQ